MLNKIRVDTVARNFTLTGRVQGVGFRPFVYRIAHEHGVHGWVRNTVGRVEIHAEGNVENLEAFRHALIAEAPPLSSPLIEFEDSSELQNKGGFYILPSDTVGTAEIHVPADQYLCPECEAELQDSHDRRFSYPFINCTQCGPRYTIIKAMPYDRANTSMEKFTLCERCHAEYQSADSRRFHAEPNACPDCGPHLSYFDPQTMIEADSGRALDAAVEALQRGRIIAVKGVGGFHLMCDAANEVSVIRLRKNKHRPHKPLAVMVPSTGEDQLDGIRQLVEIDTGTTMEQLSGPSRPIILLPKKADAMICNEIAPDLTELGVMLPPSPMHLLLANAFGKPLVATSGNISGEPVITDELEAEQRLGEIAEGWLVHDRVIVRPADDTVMRVINGRPRMIRPGRGTAPVEGTLPFHLEQPVIAVGGHMKNTVTLAWQNRFVVSPHIGELNAVRSMDIFRQVIGDLQNLYQVEAKAIVCDLHPHYASSRWAHEQNLPCYQVQHHRAHASALLLDDSTDARAMQERGLVFTWDGVGYGDDGRLWGGETFLGKPGQWQRVASFRNFRLIGGDRVAHEPWRSAAALYWELEELYPGNESEKLAYAAWQSGLNSFESSAVGRLFDAAAAIMGLVHTTSHEGEAPMRLDAIAQYVESADSLPFKEEDDLLRIDWAPLFYAMKDNTHPVAYRAGYFHSLLANTISSIAGYFSGKEHLDYVGLTGGVFQNRKLTELTTRLLDEAGIPYRLGEQIPVNDGGISYGQLIEYSAIHENIN